jgi:hypothetical protein
MLGASLTPVGQDSPVGPPQSKEPIPIEEFECPASSVSFSTCGMNDSFAPNYEGDADYLLQIFNRWGSIIFETSNPEDRWTGDIQQKKEDDRRIEAPAGSYYYSISIGEKSCNGTVTYVK